MSKFKTLKTRSTSFFKEKGSKFYGYAFPITSKEDVKSCLEEIQAEHPKARHICSAFLLGTGNEEYYITNDDGEPSNSAGAPILGQIRSVGITNVYIAIVRYFGGTKLGVGGLIQAYKLGASLAIESSEIIEVEPQDELNFKVGFNLMGTILAIIDKNNLKAKIENLTDGIQVCLQFDAKDKKRVEGLFSRYVLLS